MSAYQPIHSSQQFSSDSLCLECIEKIIPLAGERIQAVNLDWWDVDRFLGLAFHILLTDPDLSTRQSITQFLPKFGAKAVPTLIVICQHKSSDATLRQLSSQALAQIKAPILVVGLIHTLQTSEDDRFDLQVSQQLATVAPEAIAALTTLIATDEWRILALKILHKMQLPQTRTLLNQLRNHSNPHIREATIDVLSESIDQQVLYRLETALSRRSSPHPITDKTQTTPNPIIKATDPTQQSLNVEDLMK